MPLPLPDLAFDSSCPCPGPPEASSSLSPENCENGECKGRAENAHVFQNTLSKALLLHGRSHGDSFSTLLLLSTTEKDMKLHLLVLAALSSSFITSDGEPTA